MTPDQFWLDVSQPFCPPVVLPDIGTFFNQDMQLAERLMQAVAESGARYVKGEILHDADICLPSDTAEHYLGQAAEPVSENYRALIERKTVSLDQYRRLFESCPRLGLGLVLSVYDPSGANFAREVGACALKIASTNVVHAPLIRYCASLGLPLIIDTGKATLAEAERAVSWAREGGATRLIVEYSPPAPPAPLERHNLRVLPELQKLFGLPIGLSDHHHGEEMLYAAAALGCRVLEKGLCDTDADADQDVFHALPLQRLREVINACHNVHAALGEAHAAYAPPAERPSARMGLVAQCDLQPGEKLTLENVRFAFPTLGIPVEKWDAVAGNSLSKPVAANTPVDWSDVDS